MFKKSITGKGTQTYIAEDKSNFQKGLDMQRELFKRAKGNNDYDGMCDSIENLKSETKNRFFSAGFHKTVTRIEKIIAWYRNKEAVYSKRTEEGWQVIFPPDMNQRVNQNLTKAYELIIECLDKLGLL